MKRTSAICQKCEDALSVFGKKTAAQMVSNRHLPVYFTMMSSMFAKVLISSAKLAICAKRFSFNLSSSACTIVWSK